MAAAILALSCLLVLGSFIAAAYVTAIALPPPLIDNTLRPLGPVSTGPRTAARRAENRFSHPPPNANPSASQVRNRKNTRRVGSGWTLTVKWKGYPDTTSEPLSRVLKDTNHHDILQDIAQRIHAV